MKRARLVRAMVILGAGLFVIIAGVGGYGVWVVRGSIPVLRGVVSLPGLSESVSIERDAQGIPTIVAGTREDLARSLGFLHGQERFFEMDLLRRIGAGELSGLVGSGALPLDRAHRLHRFRTHAQAVLQAQDPRDLAVLHAYTQGVNAGLHALGHAPFEY